jgi:hypothetical protein
VDREGREGRQGPCPGRRVGGGGGDVNHRAQIGLGVMLVLAVVVVMLVVAASLMVGGVYESVM